MNQYKGRAVQYIIDWINTKQTLCNMLSSSNNISLKRCNIKTVDSIHSSIGLTYRNFPLTHFHTMTPFDAPGKQVF